MRSSPVFPLFIATLLGSCAAQDQNRVVVATNLTSPRGVLTRATKLALTVSEGDVACDAAKGEVSTPSGPENAKQIASRELGTSGCAPNVRFCGDLTIEKSDAMRVFEAKATDANGATLALGCTTAKVDQDQVPISIRMARFLPPATCNNGTVEPTEQCEPGGTVLCDDKCQSKEFLLSTGTSSNGTTTGGPGDKTDPFFLWPEGAGSKFVACFTDRAVTGAGNVEVGLRVMADDLSPLPASVLAAGSIFMPNGATFPPVPSPKQQSFPQAAFAGGKYYIAFQDDDTAGNGLDIHLRSMDAAFVAGEGATPIGVNGTDGLGEANNQIVPAMAAGPKGRLYVAWEDTTAGKIAGRTVTPPNTLGNQNDLSTGTINTNVSVAATLTGWVAAWQSGTGIKLRVLNEDGTPQGADQSVSDPGGAATRPRVASLPDGRFAVAWVRDGDIYVQRYDGKGVKIAGDQAAPINENTAGEQASPAIGGSSAVGGSYVVAWLDVGESHVHARMLGGSSGFLFNNVDGQAGDFKASIGDGRTRKTPVVIAGGAAPFVAIGWEDATAGGAGIVVRRFPVPTD